MSSSLSQAKNRILPIIQKYLDTHKIKIFVFGSQATDKSHDRSDIDVGLLGAEPVPLEVMMKIEHDLEEVPYLIDLVDFSRVSSRFKDIALRKVIPWTTQN